MHFQKKPFANSKLIHVVKGEILDVIIGINKHNFGKTFSIILNEFNRKLLYVPCGYAHGFLALSDIAIVCYGSDFTYSKEHDSGIRFDTFDFEWPTKKPLLNERDKNLMSFDDFRKLNFNL
jgi:dTDP-4-dehydrorhamnose 3,5-epimerase